MSDRMLELQLLNAYRSIAATYAKALPRLESLQSVADNATFVSEWCAVQSLLSETLADESTLAERREQWLRSGASAGVELREALEHTEKLLQRILELIRLNEQAISQREATMMQELANHERGRRMHSAYSASMQSPQTPDSSGGGFEPVHITK